MKLWNCTETTPEEDSYYYSLKRAGGRLEERLSAASLAAMAKAAGVTVQKLIES